MNPSSRVRRAMLYLSAGALISAAAVPASAQSSAAPGADWPTRPVRIIVPYPPGGVGDLGTRAFAQRLSQRIGQPVLVDNIPGGTQIVGMQALIKAPADGHTLILASPTSLVLNPALRTSLPYDPDKLSLVSRLFSSPLFIIASNKLAATNVQELVSWARANPDQVNYVSTGEGSATHLATALFAQMTNIRMKHVPYKGSSGANQDLVSGEVHVHFDPGAGTLALVADGRLKVLAVSGAERSRVLPDVPTVMESGVPGYEVVSWWALAAPEGTPPAVAERIAAAVRETTAEPGLAEQARKLAIDYGGSTPAAFRDFVATERERWGQMIDTLGLKPQ